MTYVDDILVAGKPEVVQAVMAQIRGLWTTSEPDEVGVTPIRFLGVEISKVFDAQKGREIWYIGQQSFIKDLLTQDEDSNHQRSMSIGRRRGENP